MENRIVLFSNIKGGVGKTTLCALFASYLAEKGISEQGVAIWLPKEVKKRLEVIRANADRNIPLRSLAAAIIMTYIEENEVMMREL